MGKETVPNAGARSSGIGGLLDQQMEMGREWQAKQPATPMRYDWSATKYVVPPVRDQKEKIVSLGKNPTQEQRLIFAALCTAHYRLFYTDEIAESVKAEFSGVIGTFVRYLNDYKFTSDNRISVLKNYETYRVTVDYVKTQSTGLRFLIRYINYALDYREFRRHIDDVEYGYLYTLTKTKAAPLDSKTQITLTNWFASHTWLRREDVGIGHELYSLLKSPKLLVSSFQITVVTALQEIQLAKRALIEFFIKGDWELEDIPLLRNRGEFEFYSDYKSYQFRYYSDALNLVRERRNQNSVEDDYLDLAIELIVGDTTVSHSWGYVMESIRLNRKVKKMHHKKGLAKCKREGVLFSFSFVRKLLEYVVSAIGSSSPVPTCEAEEMMFGWLMVYQTVQPTDISKLSSSDFQFIRNRKEQITHLELQYFKGRSGVVHSLKMIERKSMLGTAVLRFLQDKGQFEKGQNQIRCKLGHIGYSVNSWAGSLFLSMDRHMRTAIERELAKRQASTVFLDSMIAIITNGVRYNCRAHKSPESFAEHIDTPADKTLFSLTAIKNSSVHARSDTFTPTQLLNYHSHTNEVERASYLSPDNQEWLNNCGLVTRAVMQDLAVNLFRASEKDQRTFNTEFTQSSETIDSQRDEILSRMKLITGKQNGSVDELGFTKYVDSSGMPGALYLVDCAETVLKHRHFLVEAAEKYSLLLANSPEYLLFRVLPTVEWIELLFEHKRFSEKSIIEGEAMYEKFSKDLPPLFMAKIGGQ